MDCLKNKVRNKRVFEFYEHLGNISGRMRFTISYYRTVKLLISTLSRYMIQERTTMTLAGQSAAKQHCFVKEELKFVLTFIRDKHNNNYKKNTTLSNKLKYTEVYIEWCNFLRFICKLLMPYLVYKYGSWRIVYTMNKYTSMDLNRHQMRLQE